MPLDLVLVRHGKSEANFALSESKVGNDEFITPEFRQTHESQLRLTPEGRSQAVAAGKWICENISYFFGAYLTSEYVRALETAALLDLPNAHWTRHMFLRERHFGRMSNLSYKERQEKFAAETINRKLDAFYWTPPGGESLASVALRVDYVLDSLAEIPMRPSSAIIVSHMNVMQIIRARIESITQSRFKEEVLNARPDRQLPNAAVIHYSRIDPFTKRVSPVYRWRRIAVPYKGGKFANPKWERIEYGGFTNKELERMVMSK